MDAEKAKRPEIWGLAWDDKPEDYMAGLREKLERLGIGLDIHRSHEDFVPAFDQNKAHYKFVILDLFDDENSNPKDLFDNNPPNSKPRGKELAEHVARAVSNKPWYPIFILTQQLSRLQPKHMDQTLPPNAFVRYKAEAVFLASLIKEDLVQRGIFTRRRQVFLIHSTSREQREKVEEIRRWLTGPPWKLKIEEVTPGTLGTELTSGLLAKMNRCAGIIAICTPDELLGKEQARTRPNVTLEIGMALGLPRGLDRLIVIKQKKVERLSDLGGVLTLDYDNGPHEIFEDLENRLELIGVDLKGDQN